MPTVAATLSLTGPYSLQGRQAAQALRWWADVDGVDLLIKDDAGSPATAEVIYRRWLDDDVDIFLGPYGSGLVKLIGPLVAGEGRVLWNHGGSSDSLARPFVATLPAPASTYFHGAIDLAAHEGMTDVLLAAGRGGFAAAVAKGAESAARERGLSIRTAVLDEQTAAQVSAGEAVLVVGVFQTEIGLIPELRRARPGLIAAVSAGLHEFGLTLGAAAEGVVGPVQWIPSAITPDIGPCGLDFSDEYEKAFGVPPDYVAAQAAAAGLLAHEAHRLRLGVDDIVTWRTSTLLGPFQLDGDWRQIGNRVASVRWVQGRRVPIGLPPPARPSTSIG